MVRVITRRNHDATLDVIITNLPSLYHPPVTLPPLDNDDNQSGKPSDHLIVVMEPLSSEFPTLPKRYKVIKYRPFPDSGIRDMGQWIQSQSWHPIFSIADPNLKAKIFEEMIMEKVDFFFPEKCLKVNENDQPWVDAKLLKIDRQRKREYCKKKKSEKWKRLDQLFSDMADQLKEFYYKNMVEDLKTSNVGQWYSKIKRMSSIDPTQEDKVNVEEIMDLPSQQQAEKIADSFATSIIQNPAPFLNPIKSMRR